MDTQKMRYLLKIVELGSITEAAKQLYISQPALSQTVAYMEQKFAIKIFSRKDEKLSLTDAGEVLINAFHQELRIEENLQRQLQDVKSEYLGAISIGMTQGRLAQFLPVILPSFVKEYPKISIHVNTNSVEGLENLVLDGKVDFAFAMDAAVIPPSKRNLLIYEPLFQYQNLLAVPPNHPLAKEANGIFDWNERPPIDLLKVKDEPFIRLEKDERTALMSQKIFHEYGFEPIERLTITDVSIICQLVNSGIGFAIIQEHHALNQKNGIFYRLDKNSLSPTLCLIYRKDAYLSKPARAFIDLVKHHSHLGTWSKIT